MIAILIAAASLLTQAYVFRDIDGCGSNPETNRSDPYGADPGDHADCNWPAESDSSRTAGTEEGR